VAQAIERLLCKKKMIGTTRYLKRKLKQTEYGVTHKHK
jgi:hypothetical protein